MSALAGRRIELWVEARGGAAAVNPVMSALLCALSSRGARTAVRVPEQEVVDVDGGGDIGPDLVLLKTVTAVALSLAVADEAAGRRFLNSAAASRRAHDKAFTTARLAAAGLPVPPTMLTNAGFALAPPHDESCGWVSKPVHGIHGRGVVVHDRFPTALGEDDDPDVASFVVDDGVRLVQAYLGSAPDTKVYVADGQRFVASKQFGRDSYQSDDIERATLAADETEIVHAVGEALGLRCYGVDLRRHEGAAVIIDANPFPGYRGFPDAVPALIAEVERAFNS